MPLSGCGQRVFPLSLVRGNVPFTRLSEDQREWWGTHFRVIVSESDDDYYFRYSTSQIMMSLEVFYQLVSNDSKSNSV